MAYAVVYLQGHCQNGARFFCAWSLVAPMQPVEVRFDERMPFPSREQVQPDHSEPDAQNEEYR